MYLCLCKGITERDVERSVSAGHCTAEALVSALGLDEGGTCGRCPAEIGQCGLAAWCKGAKRLSVSGDRIDATIRITAGATATARPPACGLAACGGSICAACAAQALARPGQTSSMTTRG